jgi:hypothetical protein
MQSHRRSSRFRRVLVAAVLAMSFSGAGLAATTPAQAYPYVNIYVSMPTWAGNCPSGGSVAYAWAMIGNTWSGGDWGDDLIYGTANAYVSQELITKVTCRWWWGGTYPGAQTDHWITPTRYGQTWWVGPNYVSHN